MSSEWSPSEKTVAVKAVTKAKANAEKEIMRLYQSYKVTKITDLWKLEQLIQKWRKDVKDEFYVKYESMEEDLGAWIKKKWISTSDLTGLSKERVMRIAPTSVRK